MREICNLAQSPALRQALKGYKSFVIRSLLRFDVQARRHKVVVNPNMSIDSAIYLIWCLSYLVIKTTMNCDGSKKTQVALQMLAVEAASYQFVEIAIIVSSGNPGSCCKKGPSPSVKGRFGS